MQTSDSGHRDDIRDRFSRASSEVCTVSGQLPEVCCCSCCTAKKSAHTMSTTEVRDQWEESADDGSKAVNESDKLVNMSEASSDDSQNLTAETQQVAAAAEVKQPGLLKRFRMMYKQYGIVMVCVHWSIAPIWTAAFYYAAISGIDVVPILKWVGASDKVIAPFLKPAIGHAAVTYLMYKLATPARYTVTIAATQLTVKYLRRWGYLKAPQTDDSLRSLVKDGRTKVKGKMDEVRDKTKDKIEEVRDDMHELKGKLGSLRSQKIDSSGNRATKQQSR